MSSTEQVRHGNNTPTAAQTVAKTIAIYSGTFDPPTLGHLDIIERGSRQFDRVIVAIARAVHKTTLFSLAEREHLVRQSLDSLPPKLHSRVEIAAFDGLLVDFCRARAASTILRGLRSGSDFDSETQMAHMNRKLAPEIDTVFLYASADVACISSTLVREIAKLGGDLRSLVPSVLLPTIAEKCKLGKQN